MNNRDLNAVRKISTPTIIFLTTKKFLNFKTPRENYFPMFKNYQEKKILTIQNDFKMTGIKKLLSGIFF